MTKLIEAYRADRTLKNAHKLLAHVRKHPMAVCFLMKEDALLLATAIRCAENEAMLDRHHY